MTRQTYHPHVVGKGSATKLRPVAYLLSLLEEQLLQTCVSEGSARLVSRSRQGVVVFS